MDIPLATDGQGNVLGYDGKSWRPPDDVAQDKGGRKAYRFGDKWQIEPTAKPTGVPAKAEPDKGLESVAVVGSGLAKGLSSSINPLGMAGLAARANPFYAALALGEGLGRGDMKAPMARSATKPLMDAGDAFAKKADPINAIASGPLGYPMRAVDPKFQTFAGKVAEGPEAVAKYADVEYTPGLKLASTVAEGVGAGAGSFLPFGVAGLSKNAPNVGRSLLANAGYGASMGLGQGAGEAVGGPVGALIGAGAGMLAPATVRTGLKTAGAPLRAAGDLVNPFTKGGRERVVAKILDEAAGTGPRALEANPLPGAQLTLAERTNNPGLLALQRTVAMESPTNQGAFQGARASINQVGREALSGIAPGANADAASRKMAGALTDARGAVGKAETNAWTAFREKAGTSVYDAAPLRKEVASVLRELPPPDRRLVPGNALKDLSSIFDRGATDLREIQAIRSQLGDAIRARATAGEKNAARIARDVRSALDRYIENLPIKNPETVPYYQAARSATRERALTFEDSRIGGLFQKDSRGNARVAAEDVAKSLLQPRSARGETLTAAERAARAGGQEENFRRAGKEYVVADLLKAVDSRAFDSTGNPMINSRMLRDAIKAHRGNIDSFLPGSKPVLDSVTKAAEMAERSSKALGYGSETYARFQGRSFIDGIVGRLLSANIAGPARGFAKIMYNEPVEQVRALLARAMLDPELGAALLAKASSGNAKLAQRMIERRYPSMAPIFAAFIASSRATGE